MPPLTPTRAEIDDAIGKRIFILHQLELYGTANAENLLDHESDAIGNLITDRHEDSSSAVKSFRAGISDLLDLGRDLLDPHILDLGENLGEASTDPDDILVALSDDMVANSDTFESRDITHGSLTPDGGNTGNGFFARLILDKDGFSVEDVFPQTVEFECTEDNNTGADRGNESFAFNADPPGEDNLNLTGTGGSGEITVRSSDTSILTNSSFGDFDGAAAAPSDIVGWTPGIAGFTSFEIDEVNFFRQANNEEKGAALKFTATDTLTQKLTVSGESLEAEQPYLLSFRARRDVAPAASGTLIVSAGSRSVTVVFAAQVGYNVFNLLIDQNLFGENMYQDDFEVKLDWTRTAGDLLIDELIFQQIDEVEGTWPIIETGATLFQRGDKASYTDTSLDTGIRQKWFWRIYDYYAPHTTGAPTIPDPT